MTNTIDSCMIAIDPGPLDSAYVVYRRTDSRIIESGQAVNADVLHLLRTRSLPDHLAVEMIASYGMAVGREVFDTCVWIGRFVQAWGKDYTQVYRAQVKSHICHTQKASDANIRAAILDRFGGKDAAIGKKKTPGPLYEVRGDVWSALAVAITWSDQHPLVPAAV